MLLKFYWTIGISLSNLKLVTGAEKTYVFFNNVLGQNQIRQFFHEAQVKNLYKWDNTILFICIVSGNSASDYNAGVRRFAPHTGCPFLCLLSLDGYWSLNENRKTAVRSTSHSTPASFWPGRLGVTGCPSASVNLACHLD